MNRFLASDINNVFNPPRSTDSVGSLVTVIVRNAIFFAALIFALLIFSGGFMMIAGAGSGDPQQLAKGQRAVTIAVVGFVIIFTAYWLVGILGKLTGVNML